MTTQLLTLSAKKQASGTKKILFQNETYLQQIAVNAAPGGRSLPFTQVSFWKGFQRLRSWTPHWSYDKAGTAGHAIK